ncbi:hypothetical protein P3X46_023013 [Hevea brasiliensis]|uniref:BHLH domain-containing protein n=1 Tax=Hevea brasiliensis TaxID=3981 RepID=A0ABQ9L9N6_HEVBR|nr:transcription factor bHLH75-like [Hevea brasiliensis]KAJ9163335.1 hypothetical protein P3X46_023013 [Hevea brasiliensis]
MAHEFTGKLQNLKPSFSGINSSSWPLIGNINQRALENFSSTGDQDQFVAFSNGGSFSNHQQQPHLPMNFATNIQSLLHVSPPPPAAVSGTGQSENIKNFGGRKRKRKDEKDLQKPTEVVHVRAKRGQATDSHSLAERVRREKINEKLRHLQDLVPGCYKTMGMAVMLDVIINYVQSLQNQIEFLSMKLSAASMHYDFNLEKDNIETIQGPNAYEVQEMEKIGREGYGEPCNYFNSAWPL